MHHRIAAGALACLAAIASLSAHAAQPQPLDLAVKESCTQAEGDAFYTGVMRWECSDYKAATLRELQAQLSKTHKTIVDNDDTMIFKADGEDVRIFKQDGVAYRFHRIMKDGVWDGIGVSLFCTSDCSANRRHIMTTRLPFDVMYVVGPPMPEAPPVLEATP